MIPLSIDKDFLERDVDNREVKKTRAVFSASFRLDL
jgi:hypothetical protein